MPESETWGGMKRWAEQNGVTDDHLLMDQDGNVVTGFVTSEEDAGPALLIEIEE